VHGAVAVHGEFTSRWLPAHRHHALRQGARP